MYRFVLSTDRLKEVITWWLIFLYIRFCAPLFRWTRQYSNILIVMLSMQLAFQVLVSGVLRCVFIFIPFVAFQAYGYYNLCDGVSPDKLRPWCKAKIPLLYNFIQSHYWYVYAFYLLDFFLFLSKHVSYSLLFCICVI